MNIRLENFNYKTGTFPVVDVFIENCWVDSEKKAKTLHKVYAVVDAGTETESKEFLNSYNHPFDYAGGDIFEEAKVSLESYFADPAN